MNNPHDQNPMTGSSPNQPGGNQTAGNALVREDSGSRLPDFNSGNRKTLRMGGILVANGKLRQDQIDLVLNELNCFNHRLRFNDI